MIALFLLNLVLSLVPYHGYAPLSLLATIRLDRPALGEVCLQLEALDDSSALQFRESCEGINGRVKQIRWRAIPAGEYRLRAVYRGGTETVVTSYQNLRVIALH